MPFGSYQGEVDVRVVADATDFQKNATEQLTKTGKAAGGKFAGALGSVLKKSALAIGVAAGATVSYGLAKGLGRLTALEQARVKMKALLGSTEQVEKAMRDVDKAVTGTAFSLDEGATAATFFLTAGIKPGKELQRVLKNVTDAATYTGTGMLDIADIFGEVAAYGKVTTDVLNRLSERGLPALTWLAESLGKSREETAKLVSEGKINLQQFSKAMEENLGNAAASAGNTFLGTFANLKTGLARSFAKLLGGTDGTGGIFGALKPVFTDLREFIKRFDADAGALGDRLGTAFTKAYEAVKKLLAGGGIKTVLGVLSGGLAVVIPLLLKGGGAFSAMGSALGFLKGPLGKVVTSLGGGSTGLLGALKFLAGPVGIIIGLFTTLFATSEDFRSAVQDLLGVLMDLAKEVFDALLPVFEDLAKSILPIFKDLIADLAPIFSKLLRALAPVIASLIKSLLPVIVTLVKTLLPILVRIFSTLVPVIVKIAQTIMPIFVKVFGVAAKVIEAILPIVAKLIEVLAAVLMPIIEALLPVVEWVFDGILAVVEWAVGKWEEAFEKWGEAFDWIADKANWLWENVISPVFDWIADKVKKWWKVVSKIFEIVGIVIYDIGMLFKWLWTNGVRPIFNWIKDKIGDVWNWLSRNVFDKMKVVIGVVGDKFSWFYDHAVKPVWDKVKSILKTGWDWVSRNVFDPFKKGLGKVGDKFADVRDAIKKAWDKIKGYAAKPIKFVIQHVIGDTKDRGIIGGFNWIARKIGGKEIPGVPLPSGLAKYAAGGVLPGYTPGRDVHRFWSPTAGYLDLSGGEGILIPQAVRMLGGAMGIAGINAFAKRGYASGGVLGTLASGIDWLTSKGSDAWDWVRNKAGPIWDAVTHPFRWLNDRLDAIPGIGLVKDAGIAVKDKVVDIVVGKVKEIWSKFKEAFSASGLSGVIPPGAEGYLAMKKWAEANLPGQMVTSTLRPGAITAVGTTSLHALGRAIDIAPGAIWAFQKIVDAFGQKNIKELIYSPMGGQNIYNGRRYWPAPVTLAGHWNHIHWGMANGGLVPQFDRGGTLPPGYSTVYNGTGNPETLVPLHERYGDTIIHVHLDPAKVKDWAAFMDMVEQARVTARRTQRSGTVRT